MTHIGTIIAGITADLARKQTRWLAHDLKCPYFERVDTAMCTCSARPVLDLLLYLAQRDAAT